MGRDALALALAGAPRPPPRRWGLGGCRARAGRSLTTRPLAVHLQVGAPGARRPPRSQRVRLGASRHEARFLVGAARGRVGHCSAAGRAPPGGCAACAWRTVAPGAVAGCPWPRRQWPRRQGVGARRGAWCTSQTQFLAKERLLRGARARWRAVGPRAWGRERGRLSVGRWGGAAAVMPRGGRGSGRRRGRRAAEAKGCACPAPRWTLRAEAAAGMAPCGPFRGYGARGTAAVALAAAATRASGAGSQSREMP